MSQRERFLSSPQQSSPIFHHLRRSNAIRIKSQNHKILPDSLRRAIHDSNFEKKSKKSRLSRCTERITDKLTLLDQIKQGVRLQPISEISRIPSSKHKFDAENETLADLLARVLKKRNLVMQQTDDESDLSSIDSQPDYYHRTDCHMAHEELTYAGMQKDEEDLRVSPMNGLQQTAGRIDIIVHL